MKPGYGTRQKHATKLSANHRGVGILRRKQNEELAHAKKAGEMIAATPEEFKAQLTRRYGNPHRGWLVLCDGHDYIQYGKFAQAVRVQGYRGDIKQLWKTVTGERSFFKI